MNKRNRRVKIIHGSWTDAPNSADLLYLDPPYTTNQLRRDKGGTFPDVYAAATIVQLIVAVFWWITSKTFVVHLDYRLSWRVQAKMYEETGLEPINEIIWAYDYGGRPKDAWARKHDILLVYQTKPVFYREQIERIPYMAPGLAGKEKSAKGKLPTDVWWYPIVPTNGKERVGYPTQKPIGVLERLVLAYTKPGELVVDPMAGSGTMGAACQKHGRNCVLVDKNPEAIAVMEKRLSVKAEGYSARIYDK